MILLARYYLGVLSNVARLPNNSAPLPVPISIHEPGGLHRGFTRAHAEAVLKQRAHTFDNFKKSIAGQPADPTPQGAVTPVQAMYDTLGRLLAAFRAAEGRDPEPEDTEFWAAYDEVIRTRLGLPNQVEPDHDY